jgi:SAM-dependent methyltransferase
MSVPPQIFDRRLLRVRKARAAGGMAGAAFLLEHAATDLAERLSLMSRWFELGLDLGAHGRRLSERLLQTGKVGRMLCAPLVAGLTTAGCDAVVCDEEVLPFAPASLDLVVSALSLQLVNDLPGALAQIRRALRPDGLFLAALLGGRTLEQLRAAFASAEIELTGGLSPRVAPFADVRDLGALLQRAGFALPVADTEQLTVTYADPLALMADLKAMGASNMLSERRKTPATRALLAAASDTYRKQFAGPDRRVPATFEIVTLTGWAQHEGQQKPLRPGSAKSSLKSALMPGFPSPQGGNEGIGD